MAVDQEVKDELDKVRSELASALSIIQNAGKISEEKEASLTKSLGDIQESITWLRGQAEGSASMTKSLEALQAKLDKVETDLKNSTPASPQEVQPKVEATPKPHSGENPTVAPIKDDTDPGDKRPKGQEKPRQRFI